MNANKRRPYSLADLTPVLLVVAATLFGVALGKTGGGFVVKAVSCALMAGAFIIRHLYDKKLGLYIEVGLVAAYVALGVLTRITGPWSWMLFVVGTALLDHLLGMVFKAFGALRRENRFERDSLKRATTVDAATQLRNVRAYLNDAMIYIRFTRRYELNLGLILWRLDNTADFRERLGKVEFDQLIMYIAEKIRCSLRFEDMIFTFEDADDRLTIGTLHIANNPEVCAIVEKRLRAMLDSLDTPEGLTLSFTTHHAMADQIKTDSPMALLEQAREQFAD